MRFLRVFKKFLKVVRVGKKWSEGVKNGVKWGKKLEPISAFIHYLQSVVRQKRTRCVYETRMLLQRALF